ncbi:energy transducer TonB [Chitinimonas lacunae]|uniref:Protein TonB n=1 Tax=Chitinimonas lacunae TaxID=1963018 RepID=A0ABV8MLZ9_9NEIS
MRRGTVLAGVAAGHVGLLWWLAQSHLSTPITPPVPLLVASLVAPAPEPTPVEAAPTSTPPEPSKPVPLEKRSKPMPPSPKPVPTAQPLTAVSSAPSPIVAASPAVETAPAAPPAPQPSPAPAPAPVEAPLVLPRSDAAYLNNPKPPYPPLSRKLEEEGQVVLSVHILPDGTAGEVKLKRSSGYARLDQSALEVVKKWRFVPAKRGNEPVAYTYDLPITFSLRD